MSGLRVACTSVSLLALAACQMPNPAFDPLAGTDETTTRPTGDGDGDPGETGDAGNSGDGDGDPGDGDEGDGDGDEGDGDGDEGDGDGDPVACAPPLMECDGDCVDPKIEFNHCGGCGNVCAEQQLCLGGACKNKRYVFVSSELRGALFDLGIGQANGICNQLAETAALPGTYAAWMSRLGQSPSESPVEAVFVRTDEHIVATSWADLTDGTLLEPINLTEAGVLAAPSPACDNALARAVWTATNTSGEHQLPDCLGWLINTPLNFGKVGNADAIDASWTSGNCNAPCSAMLRIYCVQQ